MYSCTVLHLHTFNFCDKECSKFQWLHLRGWGGESAACYQSAGHISQIRKYDWVVIHKSLVHSCTVSQLHAFWFLLLGVHQIMLM